MLIGDGCTTLVIEETLPKNYGGLISSFIGPVLPTAVSLGFENLHKFSTIDIDGT